MKKLLIFALLIGLLLALTSCQIDGIAENGDYYEIDVIQEIKNWSDNNGLALGWEILIFILCIPLILVAAAVGIVYIVIVYIFNIIIQAIVLIVAAIGAIISLAIGLFGA